MAQFPDKAFGTQEETSALLGEVKKHRQQSLLRSLVFLICLENFCERFITTSDEVRLDTTKKINFHKLYFSKRHWQRKEKSTFFMPKEHILVFSEENEFRVFLGISVRDNGNWVRVSLPAHGRAIASLKISIPLPELILQDDVLSVEGASDRLVRRISAVIGHLQHVRN